MPKILMRSSWCQAIVLCALLVPTSALARDHAPGESALLGRLLAPCCWNQTLELHDSEIASALRAEIHERLTAGQASSAIERDLVSRYGTRILAVQGDRDTRSDVVWVTGVGMAIALVALFLAAVRWSRRSASDRGDLGRAAAPEHLSTDEVRLDAQLEAELTASDAI